jgi:tRNA nucleotidyltransferase (CCA-adding enzyme)
VEVLLMAVLLAGDTELARKRAEAYLERVRDVRLEITGEDLKRAGVPESPALGEALKETLELKLDGFVSGREEELEVALRLAGR